MTEQSNEGLEVTNQNPSVADENLLPQSKVNELIQANKNKSYQHGYQAALKEFQQQYSGAPTSSQQNFSPTPMQTGAAPHNFTQMPSTGIGGMPQQSPDELKKMFSEVFDEKQKAYQEQQTKAYHQQEANRILGELNVKINDAKKDIPDFDNTFNQIDWSQIPEVVQYANSVDNAGHVLHDLASNIGKIGILRNLPPSLALAEIKNLSNSLKGNATATLSKGKQPPEPIEQVTGSGNTSDNGQMNIDDLRSQDWLRA